MSSFAVDQGMSVTGMLPSLGGTTLTLFLGEALANVATIGGVGVRVDNFVATVQ